MNKVLIFILYMIVRPWVELWNLIKSLFEKGATLNYPRTWQYIFLFLMAGSYLAKNKFMTNIFGILLIITIIKNEWDRGFYMELYRKKMEAKAMKESEAAKHGQKTE